MDLSPDISSEDLEVFLQEAEEQIELLDEDIVRLEREEDTQPLLQEIFRAAHTLKGSAGMIGHHSMTDLAHSMENLLDQLRLGTLQVSTVIVDALLGGLDLLRVMKDELSSGQDSHVDISKAVSVLDSLAVTEDSKAPVDNFSLPSSLYLGPDLEERVHSALDAGSRVFLAKININPDTTWTSIRCFQVLDVISQSADIIISIPSLADIESERVSFLVQAVLSTDQQPEVLQQAVAANDDVDDVEIMEIDPQDSTSEVWLDLLSPPTDGAGDSTDGDEDPVTGPGRDPSPRTPARRLRGPVRSAPPPGVWRLRSMFPGILRLPDVSWRHFPVLHGLPRAFGPPHLPGNGLSPGRARRRQSAHRTRFSPLQVSRLQYSGARTRLRFWSAWRPSMDHFRSSDQVVTGPQIPMLRREGWTHWSIYLYSRSQTSMLAPVGHPIRWSNTTCSGIHSANDRHES